MIKTMACGGENTRELLMFIKSVVASENEAQAIFKRWVEENISANIIKWMDKDSLYAVGFKIGDVAKINMAAKPVDGIKEKKSCRQERIQQLIGQIKETEVKDGKVPRRKVAVGKQKIYIGWQHKKFGCESFKKVQFKDGGGVRCVELAKNDSQKIDSFIEIGTKLFFSKGFNTMGSLDEMHVSLGDFSGRIIEEFKDVEEQNCSFKKYILSHGLCTSKNNIFLMTSDKSQEEACSTQSETDVDVLKSQDCTPKQLHIANVQSYSELNIKYLSETESSYSEVCTRLSCHSLQDCRNVAFSFEACEDNYNPLLDGFKVLSIYKDGEQLLGCKYEEDGTTNDNIIIYGPDTVNGKESSNGNIILGVVASCHGKAGCEYTWFKDGSEYLSGVGLAILEISIPGTYTVGVKFDSVLYIHEQTVTITQDEEHITSDTPGQYIHGYLIHCGDLK